MSVGILQKKLKKALEDGNLDTVKECVEKIKKKPCNWRYNKGWGLIHIAAFFGNLNVVKYLIETEKFNVDMKCIVGIEQWRMGWTALHMASEQGYKGVVRYLLKKGANTKIVDYYKKTALDVARNDKIEKILKGEDDSDEEDFSYDPVHQKENDTPDYL